MATQHKLENGVCPECGESFDRLTFHDWARQGGKDVFAAVHKLDRKTMGMQEINECYFRVEEMGNDEIQHFIENLTHSDVVDKAEEVIFA